MFGLGLSLSLGSQRRGSGGTPTPTPTPTPASSIISYNADLNQAEVTNPGVGSTWTWRVFDIGFSPDPSDPVVSGATGTTASMSGLTYGQGIYNVPDNTWARHSNALYSIVEVPEPVITHYPSAGKANGRTLVDEGWTQTGLINTIEVQSNLWTYAHDYYNFGGWKIDVGSPDHAVGFSQIITSGHESDSSATAYNMGVRVTDANNGIGIDGSTVNGAHIYCVVGGVGTDLNPGSYTIHPPTGDIELKIIGNTVYVLVDGEVFPQSVLNPRRTNDDGLDITDLAGDLPTSNKVAINWLGYADSPPIATADDIFTEAYPAAQIAITADFSEATFDHNYVNLHLVGAGPSGMTSYMIGWRIGDQPVAVSGPYAATAGAINTQHIETPSQVEAAEDVVLSVWNAADPSVFGYLSVSPAAYPRLRVSIPGHQSGDFTNYSEECYILHDQAYLARWFCDTNNPDPDLRYQPPLPDGSLPAGATFFRLICAEKAQIGYGMATQWTVDHSALTGFTVTAGPVEEIDSSSIGSTTSHYTPIADGRPFFSIDFTPTAGQKVPMDIPSAISITRDADTSTGPIADLALGSFPEGTLDRAMKQGRVEAPYVEDEDAPGGLVTPAVAHPALLGRQYAQKGTRPVVCMPVNAESNTYTRYWAEQFKTTVPAGVPIIHTRFNELFNDVYFYNRSTIMTRACAGGFIVGVPAGVYENYAASDDANAWDIDPYSHLTKVFIPAGTKFFANIGSHGAYLALQNINIGDTIPTSTNSQVQVLQNDHDAMFDGAYKRQLWDIRQDHAVFVEVFGDRNPILDCWENFQLQSWEEVMRILSHEVDDVAIGRGLKLFGGSHYTNTKWYWESAPSEILNFHSDPSGFEDWWHDTFADAREAVRVAIKSQWYGTYAACRALGWAADEVPDYTTYEGDDNFDLLNVPAIYRDPADPGFVASLPDAIQAILLDSRTYDGQLAYQQSLSAMGLYGFVNFQLHSRIGHDSSEIRTWQFLRRVNSMNDPSGVDQSFKAYKDHCVAVL